MEKTKGRKRHIVTDTIGNLLAVHVHATNVHDTKGGVFIFRKALFYYPSLIGACADNAYRKHFKNTFEIFYNIKADNHEKVRSAFQRSGIISKTESSPFEISHSRRLSKDYEIKTFYAKTMVIISHLHTLLKRF